MQAPDKTSRVMVVLVDGTKSLLYVKLPGTEPLLSALFNLARHLWRYRPEMNLSHYFMRVNDGTGRLVCECDDTESAVTPLHKLATGATLAIHLFERPAEGPLGPCSHWWLLAIMIRYEPTKSVAVYNELRQLAGHWCSQVHHQPDKRLERRIMNFHWYQWGWLYTGLMSLTQCDVLYADVLHYCAGLLRDLMTDNR